jgi:cysteine-rich repeat protein
MLSARWRNRAHPSFRTFVSPGFDGETARGDWTLEVEDKFWEDGGTLDSWSLGICSAQCAIYRPLDMPKTIPDVGFGSAISKVSVSAAGVISDVNIVDLTGLHTFVQDLEFHLTSPMGTDRAVIEWICQDPTFDFALQLDDEAATAIPCPPNDGAAHLPSNGLAGFDGENPQGTRQLEVVDQWWGDAVVLESWGLEICFKSCGNGALEAGEGCDDGNIANLDGCSATCAVEPACSNGQDDDGDGMIDAGVDPGCYDVSAASRENPQCQDGLDNDQRPGIDFDGGAAANGGAPLGAADPECVVSWRNRESPPNCGLGVELVFAMPLLGWLRRRRSTAI